MARAASHSPSPTAVADVKQSVGLGIVVIGVVASYFLTPLPVAIGLSLLAVVRLWIWRAAMRREQRESGAL